MASHALTANPRGPSHRPAAGRPAYRPQRPAKSDGRGTPGAAAREDGGGRAFFPVPDQDEGVDEIELSEAEKYLLEVRKQHAALPTFTKVVNPYSTSGPPSAAPSTSMTPVADQRSATPALPLSDARHPMLPSDAWRKTFLAHFLSLRTNLSHKSTQLDATTPPQTVPARYLPTPKNGDCRAWKEYMMGAKRRRINPSISTLRPSFATKPSGDASLATGLTSGSVPQPTTSAPVDDEEAAMNNVGASGTPSVAPPTSAAYDDEEAAMNDGDGMGDALEEEEEEYGKDDDQEGWTAEEAFNAFEFGDWYDPADEGDVPPPLDAGAGDEESEDEEMEGELEPLQDKHLPREPSLSLIQGFSDKTIMSVVKHIATLIQASTTPFFPPILARWAFALLARLDPITGLLSGEHVSLLRVLARACLDVINVHVQAFGAAPSECAFGTWMEDGKVEERIGCWMVWNAVVGVWAQRDLEDEKEKVFREAVLPTPGGDP